MSAVISACGLYRYRLDREVQSVSGPVFAFFGVNPSTADANLNDATVKKWIGFCLRNGVPKFIVGNVFSYRATDVKELAKVQDLKGPEHEGQIQQIINEADILVPCWGSLSKMPKNLRDEPSKLLELLVKSEKPMLHFGFTSCGQPKHPLMLGYNTELIEWETW